MYVLLLLLLLLLRSGLVCDSDRVGFLYNDASKQ